MYTGNEHSIVNRLYSNKIKNEKRISIRTPLQKLDREREKSMDQLLYEERKRWNKEQKEIEQWPPAP